MNIKHLYFFSVCFSALFSTSTHAQSASIVNDDFSVSTPDESNANTDADYFGSSGTNALEFGADFVGLVSGSSGRTIHALFPSQTLAAIGDTITVSATFTTPATVATTNEEFRIGIFDDLGRPGLQQNTSFGSTNPNADYNNLPGFYTTIDIEAADSATDLDLRLGQAEPEPQSGTFLASSGNFANISSGPDGGYVISPNTSYTITFVVERIAGTGATDALSISSELFQDQQIPLAAHSIVDEAPFSFSYGMFGAQAGSNAVGSSNSATAQDEVAPADNDNGIDFTSLTVDVDIAGGVVPPTPSDDEEACFTIAGTNGTSVVCL